MNRKLLALIILGIIPVIILPIYAADPSEKFTFQGVLKDSSSNLVTGTKDITLDFYTASSGGTLRFSNLCDDVTVSSGLFTCTITNPYDNFFAQALFVEVKVPDSNGANSETLTPRIELVGSPYSISALKAGNDFDLLEKSILNATSVNATAIEVGQTGSAMAFNVTATGSGTVFNVTNTGTGTTLEINDEPGDTSPFVIEAGGDVGIGIANPAHKLEVGENAEDLNYVMRITDFAQTTNDRMLGIRAPQATPAATDRYIDFVDSSSNTEGYIAGNGADGITLGSATGMNVTLSNDFTVDARTFTVDSQNNRVGIGTTNPDGALHITATGSDTTPDVEGIILTASDGGNVAIEMTDNGGTPYIDFSNNLGADFDARFILVGDNSLKLEAASLMVGANSETIANSEFVAGADDLFVADMLGVETAIVTDGYINATAIEVGRSTGIAGNFTAGGTTEAVLMDNQNTGATTTGAVIKLGVATPGLANCYLHLQDSSGNSEATICGDGASGLFVNSLDSVQFGLSDAAGNDFIIDSTTDFILESDTGEVGIGIADPAAALHVKKDAGSNAAVIIEQDNIGTSDGLYIRLGDNNPGVGDSFIEFQGNDAGVDGLIDGNGAGGLLFSSSEDLVLASGTASGSDIILHDTANTNDKVGIGTTSPGSVLDVLSADIENAFFTRAAGNDVRIRVGNPGIAADANGIISWDDSEKQMQLFISGEGAGASLNIDNGGYVGIGTTSPTKKLHVVDAPGDAAAVAAFSDTSVNTNDRVMFLQMPEASPTTSDRYISFIDSSSNTEGYIAGDGSDGIALTSVSDARLKSNIRDTIHSLDDLLKIQVRDYEMGEFQLTKTGFVAQELYEAYPDAVIVGGDEVNDPELKDPWGVSKTGLIPLLVKSIQDLKEENDALKELLCLDHPEAEICQVE